MKKIIIAIVIILVLIAGLCFFMLLAKNAENTEESTINELVETPSNNEEIKTNIEEKNEELEKIESNPIEPIELEKNGKKYDLTPKVSKVFEDGALFAIADILGQTEQKFIEQTFLDVSQYGAIDRYNLANNTENQSKIVIIPRDSSITYEICDCKIGQNGELLAGFSIFDNINGPIIFTFDNLESTTPQTCIKVTQNEETYCIPVVYSGFDGHLDFGGFESLAKDISVYAN